MAELIHTHSARISGPGGALYEARIFGELQGDGTWIGWLEFRRRSLTAASDIPRVLSTDRETTQPDRAALEYWAGGLEPVYLDGAMGRAHPGERGSAPAHW